MRIVYRYLFKNDMNYHLVVAYGAIFIITWS